MVQNSDASSGPGGDSFGGVLDLGIMDQLLGLDDGELGLLEEMLALYQEDTPDRIVALAATLSSGEMSDMADVAHAIKGAASTMGAPKVRAIAAEMEAAGRLGKFEADPVQVLEQLKAAYAQSVVALEGFIAKRKA